MTRKNTTVTHQNCLSFGSHTRRRCWGWAKSLSQVWTQLLYLSLDLSSHSSDIVKLFNYPVNTASHFWRSCFDIHSNETTRQRSRIRSVNLPGINKKDEMFTSRSIYVLYNLLLIHTTESHSRSGMVDPADEHASSRHESASENIHLQLKLTQMNYSKPRINISETCIEREFCQNL